MTGSAAPKDPEKARPFFYILKDKDIFGERQKDGTGIQFIYESDGRLINSAQITGNVTDKEELTLLETVEGFGRLVHSIGVSVETDRPEETAEFVFQMYGKKDLYGGGTNLTTSLKCDGMEHRIYLSDYRWTEDDHVPGQIKILFAAPERMGKVSVRLFLNDGYEAPPEEEDLFIDMHSEEYCGMISRRNIINLQKRRIILVDHNEATQAVEGFDQAEILEIIDHHRIGSLETSGPVYFRNQPVGCTATIITQMYDENDVEIPPQTAGLLLAAILSDTLAFRSPTCTAVDVNAANRLAGIAGVDIDEFANEMFEAGEKLDGKTAEEVFLQDFKVFMCGDIRFGVAQGSYMTRKNLLAAENLLRPYLEEARNKQNVEDIYMLLTDVPKEESVVISDGRYAAEVLADGFDTHPAEDGSWTLPGVVSRKKQFIPALMTAYQEL